MNLAGGLWGDHSCVLDLLVSTRKLLLGLFYKKFRKVLVLLRRLERKVTKDGV